jgi:hypothetical protein
LRKLRGLLEFDQIKLLTLKNQVQRPQGDPAEATVVVVTLPLVRAGTGGEAVGIGGGDVTS